MNKFLLIKIDLIILQQNFYQTNFFYKQPAFNTELGDNVGNLICFLYCICNRRIWLMCHCNLPMDFLSAKIYSQLAIASVFKCGVYKMSTFQMLLSTNVIEQVSHLIFVLKFVMNIKLFHNRFFKLVVKNICSSIDVIYHFMGLDQVDGKLIFHPNFKKIHEHVLFYFSLPFFEIDEGSYQRILSIPYLLFFINHSITVCT